MLQGYSQIKCYSKVFNILLEVLLVYIIFIFISLMVRFLDLFFVVDQVVNIMVKKEAISLKTVFNVFVDILSQITINLVTNYQILQGFSMFIFMKI